MSQILKPQDVKVDPAIENDRAGKRPGQIAHYELSKAPIRCQLWDGRELVDTVPVTFDDMGHPSDVVYSSGSIRQVTRIAFVYGGAVYAVPLEEPVIVRPGNPLHLALGHLELRDKLGNVVLKAGR